MVCSICLSLCDLFHLAKYPPGPSSVANGNISFFFAAEWYFIVYTYVAHLLYPFICWWMLSLFPCLVYCNMYLFKLDHVFTFFFFLKYSLPKTRSSLQMAILELFSISQTLMFISWEFCRSGDRGAWNLEFLADVVDLIPDHKVWTWKMSVLTNC